MTSLTNLTLLDIGGIPFSEESFEALTYHLTNLKWLLAMDVTDINRLIPHMTRLHKLQHLFFDQSPYVTEKLIIHVMKLIIGNYK